MSKKKSYQKSVKFAGAIIRKRGSKWQVEINHSDKRVRKTLPTLEEAKGYAERMKVAVANQGAGAFDLDSNERVDARQALDLLEGRTTLVEAAKHWIKMNKAPDEILIAELMEDYVQSKRTQNRRPATISEIETKLGIYFRKGKITYLHELTREQILGWLDKHTNTPVGRNKNRRLIHGFLNFALKRGLIEVNPAASIENASVDKKLPEAYGVDDVEKMMVRAVEAYPSIVAHLAIGFFAGLRPTEILKLDWASVSFENGTILVRPETAKKRRTRHVTISNNLRAWLEPLAKPEGALSPPDSTYRKLRNKLKKDVGIHWIFDGLRHSFATFHLAQHEDAPKTAHQLGHTQNTDLLYNNYRSLATAQEAKRYWSIVPPS